MTMRRTWLAAVARWPVDLAAPSWLGVSQYRFLDTAAVPFRSITIEADLRCREPDTKKAMTPMSGMVIQSQSLPGSSGSLLKLHGLDLGFVLALGPQTTFDAMDISRFTRLQKLQLRHYSPGRAHELGWWLGLPASLRVLHLDGLEATCFMGGEWSHLTQLQELRISTSDDVVGFEVYPSGLPPSLRRLRISHSRKPPDAFPQLTIVPPVTMRPATASDPPPTPAQAIARAACSLPATPSAPNLVSLVVDCHTMVLPASWPLPASCAVTLHAAHVTLHAALLALRQCGDHPAHVCHDSERVAAWVIRNGAGSVKIQLCPSVDCPEDFGPPIAVNSISEDADNLDVGQWDDLGCLAEALAAPCTQLGLSCRLERSGDAHSFALVMRRLR